MIIDVSDSDDGSCTCLRPVKKNTRNWHRVKFQFTSQSNRKLFDVFCDCHKPVDCVDDSLELVVVGVLNTDFGFDEFAVEDVADDDDDDDGDDDA